MPLTKPYGAGRRLVAALAACTAFAALTPVSSHAGDRTGCDGARSLPGEVGVRATSASTLCLINAARARHGLRRLRGNAKLAVAARRHAGDMVAHRYFSHDSLQGVDFFSRVQSAGYGARRFRLVVGENLAWGSGELATPAQTVKAWMASPGHRANILRPGFREIGIGVVEGTPRADAGAGATYASAFGARSTR